MNIKLTITFGPGKMSFTPEQAHSIVTAFLINTIMAGIVAVLSFISRCTFYNLKRNLLEKISNLHL